ncbi:MAG: hypothetical protein H7328_03535 [Bdellovibrio sp.]|nr:hypothetical protein [Bdellovibrio sp.]
MNEAAEQNLKKTQLKLKTQEKQLQVVQALVNRSTGYTKAQAQASEKRLTKEIDAIKDQLEKSDHAKTTKNKK